MHDNLRRRYDTQLTKNLLTSNLLLSGSNFGLRGTIITVYLRHVILFYFFCSVNNKTMTNCCNIASRACGKITVIDEVGRRVKGRNTLRLLCSLCLRTQASTYGRSTFRCQLDLAHLMETTRMTSRLGSSRRLFLSFCSIISAVIRIFHQNKEQSLTSNLQHGPHTLPDRY